MIVTRNSTENFAKRECGGKGFNLYRMSQKGLPVPEWIVLGKSYFDNFKKANSNFFENILHRIKSQQLNFDQAEAEIKDFFSRTESLPEIISAVRQAMNELPASKHYSVRSSAADEDGLAHSFAGQLSSFLYVQTEADILKYIKLCWASAYSARSLSYRSENNLSFENVSVAVVVQIMIDPDSSGVLFTCDPVNKKTNEFVISSVYGVGEGLVSGVLDADSVWLDSGSGRILKSSLVPKTEMMKMSESGHCKLVPVPIPQQNILSLTEQNLKDLFQLAKIISEKFQRPQDVEWAIAGSKVYLLQTRPVTTLDEDLIGFPNLWDNSNIVESYGGKTLPLSFSFALRNYRNVYIQFCEVLGVPTEIIKDMDSYLSYMLGLIQGRVYYNLFNWYKLVGVLPGFQQNREFMETMMGVSENLSSEITKRIEPHPSWSTFSGKVRKLITGFNFLIYHFTIQNQVDDFLKTFHKDYDHYRRLPLRNLRGDQLILIYQEMERNMLGRWKAPIINDFLCMVHFGLLRKLTLKWLANLDSTIQNDLLSGEGGLESAEPTIKILELAREVNSNSSLKKILIETAPQDCLEALNQSSFKEFYKKVCDYIDRFGFRCMSEMKLEEIDLMSDPSYLFVVLKNYLSSKTLGQDEGQENNLRNIAEKKVSNNLSGYRKFIYFWVLKHARKAVKNRENTRFARTRIYGLARTLFQQIGESLCEEGILNSSRDIFWLEIQEVFGIYNGTLSTIHLNEIISIRKKSYSMGELEPDSRILTRGPVYWKNKFIKEVVVTSFESEDCDLKGLPCCPGVVEGEVKVISSPQDNLELNGQILVTHRTDPGWVPLYPSISALLVERGSLLSHSAIVAREMAIPTIVSIPGLTQKLKTGMKIRMDGKAGTIKILS